MINKVLRVIKEGRVLDVLNTRYKKLFKIENAVIKNQQLKDEVYRKLKKKYSYVLENWKGKKNEKSNKVWVCWLQGEENAPELIKKCISSIKENAVNREVIILTNTNYSNYIKFPNYIIEKYEKGIITYTHFSDLIRLSVLAQYGGIWLDATVLCTEPLPSYITDAPLFVYKDVNLDRVSEMPIVASSWLISSYSNNDIIVATKKLLFAYWEKENKLINYYIFHLFFKIATEKFQEEWNRVPTFSNVPPHILQFELLDTFDPNRLEQIKKMSPIHKLNKGIHNINCEKFTFYDYIINRI